MSSVNVPYYHKSIDWEKFVQDYPPPVEFEETVFKWKRDKIEKIQEKQKT